MFGQLRRSGQSYFIPPMPIANPYQMGVVQGGSFQRNPHHVNPYYPSPMYMGYPFGQDMNAMANQNGAHPGYWGNPQWQQGVNGNQNYTGDQNYPAEWILQNPLQPKKNQGGGMNQALAANPYPYMHPYPKPSLVNRPPSGVNSIMNSFKTQDGNLDLNKMLDTAGQMMNAVTQVSGLVKGLGGIFKV